MGLGMRDLRIIFNLWLIFYNKIHVEACFYAYQHNGEVYWVVVEYVSQLPGLGEESSIEETTKDLVKGFTLLEGWLYTCTSSICMCYQKDSDKLNTPFFFAYRLKFLRGYINIITFPDSGSVHGQASFQSSLVSWGKNLAALHRLTKKMCQPRIC